MTRSRPQYRLVDRLLIIALCGLVLGFIQWFARLTRGSSFLGPFLAFEFAFIAWYFTWRRVNRLRRGPICQECGRRFLPARKSDPVMLCVQCRQRTLDPAQVRKERAKGFGCLSAVGAMMLIGMGLIASSFARAHFPAIYAGTLFWIVVPLLALGMTLAVLAVLVGLAVAFALLRTLLSRSERYTLDFARKCAGAPGTLERIGPITIWSSGSADPISLFREEMETARGRCDQFLEERSNLDRPLRILCFDKRNAFVAFNRRTIPNLWNVDGLYNPSPVPTITFSNEFVPYRLSEPRLTARSLFIFHFLKTYKGFFPPFWLLHGIGNTLADSDRRDRREILNRKMIIALARHESVDSEVFGIKKGLIVKLLRNWYDHRSFARFSEIVVRSWSVCEFLGGPQAPRDRRERFRAFVKDLRPKDPQENVFNGHFGFGLDSLIDQWRSWVVAHGLGSYGPPPPEIQRGLMNGVIPTIEDQNARAMDRILAIRDMGRIGYVMGADVLIDLLKTGGEILSREAIWSLERISGHPLGAAIDKWEAWWEGLPETAITGGDSIDLANEPAAR